MLIDPMFWPIRGALLQHVDFLINLNKASIPKLIVHLILHGVINESHAIDLRARKIFGLKLIMIIL